MTTSPSDTLDTASAADGGPQQAPNPQGEEAIASLQRLLRSRQVQVDDALRRYFPDPEVWPKRLHEASAWALFGGGKRLRPVLALAAFDAIAASKDLPVDAVLPAACAVEMVHTYSLVHDDLPCMDDDDERRGRPTTHVQFGQALALLAGDALLTEAFRLISDPEAYKGAASADAILKVSRMLAEAAGWKGMVGGQAIDLGFEMPVDDEASLTFLHRRKTGELFRFSCAAGALLAGGTNAQIQAMGEYGEVLGLAFQIADDILDTQQDGAEEEDGETPSFPRLLGIDGSRQRCIELLDRCLALLEPFGPEAEPLRQLAWFAVHRDH